MMKLIESKANKSGEPNIVWREKNQHWLVKIRRRGKTFTANARTIEDAIKIRDRAMQYFNSNNEFPTREQIQANYKTREPAAEEIEFYCMNCRKTYLFKESSAAARRFTKKRHICVKCQYDNYKSKNVDVSGIHYKSNEQLFKVDVVCIDGIERISATSMRTARSIKRIIEDYVSKNSTLPTVKEALVLAEIAKKNMGNKRK